MTSVSLDAWKIEPSRSSSRLKLRRVRDVAVVGNSNQTLVAVYGKRLGVSEYRITGGRVTGMTDSYISGQAGKDGGSEDFRHMTHGFVAVNFPSIAGGDPGALLSTMLERV